MLYEHLKKYNGPIGYYITIIQINASMHFE